jgi:hypothetical protein
MGWSEVRSALRYAKAAESKAAEKTKRENDAHLAQHLRQLAKKSTQKKMGRFWAFLGKGSSKTRGGELSAFPKNSPRKYFFGGGGGGCSFAGLFWVG